MSKELFHGVPELAIPRSEEVLKGCEHTMAEQGQAAQTEGKQENEQRAKAGTGDLRRAQRQNTVVLGTPRQRWK